jgi:hypothetical protein
VLGDEDDPGGILVQAVYQEGRRGPFHSQEPVQTSADPPAPLNGKTRGLIQDDTIFVLVEDRNMLQNASLSPP